VLVMTGRNVAALERMRALAGTLDPQAGTSLHAFGWTDRMEQCLAAADLVVGKSGGLTVAEVLACGRPLLIARTLQGQESFNVQFLERNGLGRFVRDEELASCAQAWLDDRPALQAVQRAAAYAGRRDGALRVAAEVLELATREVGHSGRGLRSRAS
jgi:processive 1,2-diacylglycerol beta-glucosyltransferase